MSSLFLMMIHSVSPNTQAILKLYLPIQIKLKIISKTYGWIQIQTQWMLILIKAKVSSICKNSNSQILFILKIIITNLNSPTCKCSKLIAKHWVKTWKWLTYNMQVKRTLKFNNFLNSWVLMIIIQEMFDLLHDSHFEWCNDDFIRKLPLPKNCWRIRQLRHLNDGRQDLPNNYNYIFESSWNQSHSAAHWKTLKRHKRKYKLIGQYYSKISKPSRRL